ncbi:glutamate-1-semialdehyde 2,1-aminomutase [Desulfococcaceae bacterium HSG9]|nr:glutamate-1-semialdehyde 2,1-aminomutase [Desulfococcaceae bacterium HSG9]
MKYDISNQLFEKALSIIPGGVNSPVRACKSVGAEPLFINRADGAYLFDADGNRHIDYIGSWGPMILGHQHPDVLKAISDVLSRGTSFGAPVDLEIELAELIIKAVPSIEVVRMVNSGTEAAMSAVRLARGVTGRDIIIKFDGCYHGHADTLLVEAGSGVATLGIPGSPGVPQAIAELTLSLPYNDLDSVRQVFELQGDKIAGIIVEPVAGNMGLVRPADGFLEGLRELTRKNGSMLIFDEVMTGFRVAHGGVQALYSISPDITCLGKIIGGGLPVGAYGGSREIMANIAPQGPVYQAGTLSGNPIAMAAGIATLKLLQTPGFYEALDESTERLIQGFATLATQNNINIKTDRAGSMAGLFFTGDSVNNFEDAKKCDLQRYSTYYKKMREQGIYLAPSQFEALFVSSAHTAEDIDATLAAAEVAFGQL